MIRIMNYSEMTADEIFARSEPTADVSDIVASIIDDVRKNGDDAIIRYAAKFDGIDPEKFSLELSEEYGMYRQTYCGCVYSMKT